MNRSLVIDHDAIPEQCQDEDHAHGCPCAAGGDAIRLSYLRCSECGDFLDTEGACAMHGLLDVEMSREGDIMERLDRW